MAGGTDVRDLEAGALVEAVFAVTRKRRRSRRDGRPYLDVELADRTGRVAARVWESVPVLDGRFELGDTVRVLGRVTEHEGRVELELRDVARTDPGDPAELVPGARRDIDDLEGYVEFLAGEVTDPRLRPLVDAVLAEPRFRGRFRTAPATESGHHAYAGGLIEHTVAVCALAREAAQLHPRLDADLLLAAALLHDCGTVDCFLEGPVIRQSQEATLLGHVHLGLRRIERHAASAGTPRERLNALLGCVAAHHGPLDGRRFPSAEAVALHAANSLDARLGEAFSQPAQRS
jgi:3'-5' exoribonuclease